MKNASRLQREQSVEGFYLELELTDIDTIAYRVVDQILPIVRSRNQSLTLNLTPHLPKIATDSLRIEQILLNLLSNASKFTPDSSSISLSVNKKGDFMLIEVRDSGLCIPPEEQHEIFQPYYRNKIDSEKDTPGIGLGLALCKHLVELHGGKIWVESEQGKGNTFVLALPLEK